MVSRSQSSFSRTRAALTDFASGMVQQMVFWGCDARHRGGNLLVRLGMERRAGNGTAGEGSSRYLERTDGGEVELHSFYAGWRDADGTCVMFIRHWRRVVACAAFEPGRYDFKSASPDELLERSRPLAKWIVRLEERVRESEGPAYREACYRHALRMPGVRPWLPPELACEWFARFQEDPATVGRTSKRGLIPVPRSRQ